MSIFAPDPTGGAYSAPPEPLAGFKEGGIEGRTIGEGGREGKGGMRKEGENGEVGRIDVPVEG